MHPFNTSRKFLAIAEGAEEQREEQLRQARDEIIAEIWAQVRTTLSYFCWSLSVDTADML